MKDLLIWIKEEGYVLHSNNKWYKKGDYRPWKQTEYFTEEELIEIYDNRRKEC